LELQAFDLTPPKESFGPALRRREEITKFFEFFLPLSLWERGLGVRVRKQTLQ